MFAPTVHDMLRGNNDADRTVYVGYGTSLLAEPLLQPLNTMTDPAFLARSLLIQH